jgi:hypothetical protein
MNYMGRPTILFFLILTIFFFSCQKEVSFKTPPGHPGPGNDGGENSNNSIIDGWDYLGLMPHPEATIIFTEADEEVKTVTTSDYISKNNVGTIKITATEMIGDGIAYSVDTTMHVGTYIDNVLIDEEDLPSTPAGPTPTGPTECEYHGQVLHCC